MKKKNKNRNMVPIDFGSPEPYIFDETPYLFDGDDLQTNEMPEPESVTISPKIELINGMKEQNLQEILFKKPLPNTSTHIIANGGYNFFTFVNVLLGFIGYSDEFFGSTWTMNRPAVVEMLKLYDEGKLGSLNVITGIYFKSRESAVYTHLVQGMLQREQRYKCLENHAKLILLSNKVTGDYFVCEGSANFTANPRVEQFVVTNNKDLYMFHRTWMDNILGKRRK